MAHTLDPAEEVRRRLTTPLFHSHLQFVPICESTNTLLRKEAEADAPEGTVIFTDLQTGGKGRLGRTWFAPEGSSLLFSILLRPKIRLARIPQIAMIAGLGAVAGIESIAGVKATLKWPNDILLNGKKSGGILSDAQFEEERLRYIILGIGINVNFDPGAIEGIPADATTLLKETGRMISRPQLLAAILDSIARRHAILLEGGSVWKEWAPKLETIGRQVRIRLPDDEVTGIATGAGEDGTIQIKLRDGTTKIFHAGDVIHLRNDEDNPA